MLKRSKIYYLILTLKIILGFVFIFSGITKLLDISAFNDALINFKLITEEQIAIIKYVIPLIEIILGMSIIFNFRSSLPSFLSSILLSLFTAIIVAKLFEGEEISCGCFGALSSDKINLITIFRNLVLILFSIIVSSYFESIKTSPVLTAENSVRFCQGNEYKSLKIIIITNIIFFLTVQNLIFAFQNNGLKSGLDLLINDHDILKKEEIVRSFTLYNIDSTKVNVLYDKDLDKKTLLLLFKPTCKPCKLNLPSWTSLYDQINPSTTRILPIALDEVHNIRKYVAENLVPFPVYFTKEDDFLLNYKAFLTPQTILIDQRAKVINVWKGVLNKKNVEEIFNIIQNKKVGT